MVRWLRAAVVPLALTVLIALSGVVLGRIYADDLLLRLVAGAALGSVGVGVAVRRLPSWTVAPISVVALAGYTVGALKIAAGHAALTDPLSQIVTDALVNGIPRLLTAMIPVEATPDTVVVPVIAAWLAGLAGSEVAVRAGRVLLGCVPAAALYGGALYVVGPNAGSAGWPTLTFAGAVVAALAVTARPAGGPSLAGMPAKTRAAVRGRALAGSAAGLTVLVGLIAALGPWVGGRVTATPVDPRRYVEPPRVDSLDESPLNRISGWALAPEQKLLEVGPAVAGKGKMRLRLAVLPDYDGITWRVGATYRNAGRVLPRAPLLPDVPVTRVTQDITVQELTGRLLPVVPTPAGVDGTRIAYDAATGTVIRPEELRPGLRYTVTSDTQEPDFNLLPTADSPTGDAVARFLTVGAGVPEPIQRLADDLADGNGAAYDRAMAIEEFLAEHYRMVADAPSGHAYPNLSYFLFGPRDRGGQRGTSEQFAASFALLARLTGLPSRVVVGFDAPKAGGPVTGGDAIAWPEVLFDDLGWVAFDPLPKSDDPPRPVEDDFTPKPSPPPPASEPPPATDLPSSSAPPAVAAPPARTGGGPSRVLVASGTSGATLLVLAAAAATLLSMRRSLRRRRLSTGGAAERITGAWFEFTDALRLAGSPVPTHLAATEAAAFAANAFPSRATAPDTAETRDASHEEASAEAPPLRRAAPSAHAGLPPLDALVTAVNTVAFAPASATDDQAQRAGGQAVAYATALRQRRSWWRRAWWSLHPGPLRWHPPRR
ncbi:DUF3488 and transglutaminase-like domain-containing protein [Couchioplanes caeruleus]|uniref:Transglutaminase n=1 Tax=Couchioplanes caeruleus subsp. caeruleus TaxID=56427 RepID=A0A1K0GWB1_9ACTN|nr:transglutaminase domain-containing protein [Couchioplanes caeruleus]OJF13683.1 transglutaminase [Couchioplanes caeruleus subsp. caeruleus]